MRRLTLSKIAKPTAVAALGVALVAWVGPTLAAHGVESRTGAPAGHAAGHAAAKAGKDPQGRGPGDGPGNGPGDGHGNGSKGTPGAASAVKLERLAAKKDAALARVLRRLDRLPAETAQRVADQVGADRAALAAMTQLTELRRVRPENYAWSTNALRKLARMGALPADGSDASVTQLADDAEAALVGIGAMSDRAALAEAKALMRALVKAASSLSDAHDADDAGDADGADDGDGADDAGAGASTGDEPGEGPTEP